jgi:hypothetical protein
LAAVVRLGGKKGDLSGAIEVAVKDWLKKDDPKDRKLDTKPHTHK